MYKRKPVKFEDISISKIITFLNKNSNKNKSLDNRLNISEKLENSENSDKPDENLKKILDKDKPKVLNINDSVEWL